MELDEDDEPSFELTCFDACSVYCLKYLIWRRIQIPIQD
jgi:hypothetical protein